MVRSIDRHVIMALQHLNPISVKDLEFVFCKIIPSSTLC